MADVLLDGRSLSPDQVVRVARDLEPVVISAPAMERVEESNQLLFLAAESGQKIYGLTVGVGLNKDQEMVKPGGGLSEEVLEVSRAFNKGLIHAHCAGVGPDMASEVVRGLMTTRLNAMLFGGTGVQPRVVELYRDFLNLGITPVIPSRGSVGEADITLITHVGLAMIGEGEVDFRGKRIPAADALRQAGLEPLVPVGKDALSILSSNAYSEALASLAAEELSHALQAGQMVFAASIQAFNGNVEPFMEGALAIRPFPGVQLASTQIQAHLEGSYLWEPSDDRPLQDPLSYRTAGYTFGSVHTSLQELEALLAIQLNSSDDNPGVVLDAVSPSTRTEEASLYVDNGKLKGALIPTANFSPLPWVISLEQAGIALSHASTASAERSIKLGDPHFTHLSRFLGTDKTIHAYGAIQKVYVSLATENQELASPVSVNFRSIAGNIEDMGTNAPQVAIRLRQMIDNYYYILGLELMHAAQGADLRRAAHPEQALSPEVEAFLAEYRKVVPFMEIDRPMTGDIQASYDFLKAWVAPAPIVVEPPKKKGRKSRGKKSKR